MNTTNDSSKLLLFCLDKSNNSTLKQSLNNFSTRFFTDGKYLIKSIVLNKKTEFLPTALILTGDLNSIKEILINSQTHSLKIFIFCSNLNRLNYEPLINELKSSDHLMGLFTTTEDLKDALEDILIKPIHHRQLIRFVTGNLEPYLWYESLKETSYKINTVPSKQTINIPAINRQIEYEPLLTLYTLRSTIRNLSERTPEHKKIFYGTVIKKTLIDKLQANIDNIISFNSFVHLQGHCRTLDARQQALHQCSRRHDEVSIIFELELANQPTFKIIRVFNSSETVNLWIVQLVGTHECIKLIKQFSHIKRTMTSLNQWSQPEILFGEILISMNEIEKAYEYFFQIIINQYDQLNKIYTKANQLWKQERKYHEVVELIAIEFQSINSSKKNTNRGHEELTYLESEFDSIWETPVALEDANKIHDLLSPASYKVDQVFYGQGIAKIFATTTSRSTRQWWSCTIF